MKIMIDPPIGHYKIRVEVSEREPEIAFTWRGQPITSISRAKKEAAKLGIDCLRIWAGHLDDRIYAGGGYDEDYD